MGVAVVTSPGDRLERVAHLPVTRHNHAHYVDRYVTASTAITRKQKRNKESFLSYLWTNRQDGENTLKDTISHKNKSFAIKQEEEETSLIFPKSAFRILNTSSSG